MNTKKEQLTELIKKGHLLIKEAQEISEQITLLRKLKEEELLAKQLRKNQEILELMNEIYRL